MRLNPFRRRSRSGLLRRAVSGVVAATDPLIDQLGGERRWRMRFLLLVTFVFFWIAFGTSGLTYHAGATGMGPMVFVALVIALPLAFAITRPLSALLISVASAFVFAVTLPSPDPAPDWPWTVVQGLIIFVLLFATAVRSSVRDAIGAWLLTSFLFWWGLPPGQGAGWVVALGAISLLGVLTGRLLRARRDLREQTEVSEAERARRVVLEERARLARDLHDIVAHHMSLVVVQAETAQYRVPGLDEAARAELLSISETARSALTETRALLTVLRQEKAQIEDAPQPGLHRLGELVETTRRAGVALEAEISGDLGVLREGQSLAGFRIAQEALANASRHAPGAPVRLEAHGDAQGVRLTVLSGSPGEVGTVVETGHGIIGMRERAAAAGGTLQVGPTEGGFVVQLFLPSDEVG